MIQFSGRRHTRIGILSMVIGILAVIGFIAISIISGYFAGQAGIVIGVVGIVLFVIALFGFVLSCKALKQRDIYYRFPIIGVTANGIMMMALMVIYIMGLI